jgi:hypothetical protein
MRKSVFTLGAISLAGLIAVSTPAFATSDVAVSGTCTNLSDGIAGGCKFSGNINTNDNGNSSYLLTQNAYNAYATSHSWANISLTPLADFDPANGTSNGITLTMNGSGDGGTFSFDASMIDLQYFAVKAADGFILYEYTGANSFTTAGLAQNSHGDQTPGLSHIIFFGGTAGGVPEPATWAMMLLGIGMIGSSARRRRQMHSRSLATS